VRRRVAVAVLVALTIVTVSTLTMAHKAKEGGRLSKIGPATEFTLTNTAGGRLSLGDLRGKVVAVTFIYATCTDMAVMPDARGVVRLHGLRPFCKSMPDGAAIVSAAPSDARPAGPEVPRSPGRLSRATFPRRYFISPRRHGACRSCSASPTF
jgi:hypothetical protein